MKTEKKQSDIMVELNHYQNANSENSDVSIDELFLAFCKAFDPELIISAADSNFIDFLRFSEFSEKMNSENRFYFFDLVAKIFWLLGNLEQVTYYLKKSFEIGLDTTSSNLNEGFYYFLSSDFNKAKKVLKNLPEDAAESKILQVLLFTESGEFTSYLESLLELEADIFKDIRFSWNVCETAERLNLDQLHREYLYKVSEIKRKSPANSYKIAQILFEKVKNSNLFDPDYISNNEMEDLQKAANLFEMLVTDPAVHQGCLAKIQTSLTEICNYTGQYEKSLHYFNEIDTRLLDRGKQLFKINLLLKLDKVPEAEREVDKLLKTDPKDSDLIALKGDIYLRTGKYESALGICGTGLKFSSTGIHRGLISGKARALYFLKSSTETEDFLLEIFEETHDIYYIINLLYINRRYISLRKVAKLYVTYISKELKSLDRAQINRLAMFMYNFPFYELTAKLLASIYFPQINTELAEAYIISLNKTDKKMHALKFAQEIRITGKNEDLIPLESFLLEDTGHLDYALKISGMYYQKTKNQLSAVNYCKYLLKSNKLEAARKLLDTISDISVLPNSVMDQYIYCLIKSGENIKAFEILDNYCETRKDHDDICNYFISRFFIVSRLPEVDEYLRGFRAKIQKDSGLILRNDENESVYFVINGSFSLPDSIYSPEEEFLEELLEKKLDDAVLLEQNNSEKLFRIVEIMHRSVLKWKILTMTEKKLEVRQEFGQQEREKIQIEEIEEIFGKGAQLLSDFTFEQCVFSDMYSLRKVNFGILSTLKNVNLVNTIFHTMFKPEIRYQAIRENNIKFTKARQDLEETDMIMIDITGCIMLTHLDLWREAAHCFKRIYVAKSTINLLEASIRGNAKKLGESFGAIGLTGNIINFITTAKIQEDNWQKNIYMIITLIERNCIVIEESSKFNLGPYKEKLKGLNTRLRSAEGNSFTDSMAIAHLYHATYYTDDEVMRNIAGESGLTTIWSQPLMAYLFKKKIISLDKYFLLTTELLNINYGFVFLTIPILVKAIKNSSFKLDTTMIHYLDCFFQSDFNYISNIGSWFLYYAIKSFPMFLESNDLIMAFFNRFYSKTKDLDKLKEFINLIYKRTSNVEISNLLLTNFIKFKKYY